MCDLSGRIADLFPSWTLGFGLSTQAEQWDSVAAYRVVITRMVESCAVYTTSQMRMMDQIGKSGMNCGVSALENHRGRAGQMPGPPLHGVECVAVILKRKNDGNREHVSQVPINFFIY